MAEKVINLFCNAVQGLDPQIHAFLQNFDQSKERVTLLTEQRSVLVRLPIRINLRYLPGNKILSSLEKVQYLSLNSQEIKSLKTYTSEKELSREEGLLELIKKIISDHKDIQTIMQEHSSKKQVVVELELWSEMAWQETQVKK